MIWMGEEQAEYLWGLESQMVWRVTSAEDGIGSFWIGTVVIFFFGVDL